MGRKDKIKKDRFQKEKGQIVDFWFLHIGTKDQVYFICCGVLSFDIES